jgi:hypothetical protein
MIKIYYSVFLSKNHPKHHHSIDGFEGAWREIGWLFQDCFSPQWSILGLGNKAKIHFLIGVKKNNTS